MVQPALVEEILRRTAVKLEARRRFPESTYRLQFHAGFRFRDAEAIVPYLHDLGITDGYASPYLKARPGSQHGYDISDHRQLNPQIGSEDDCTAWAHALSERGMGQLLDVVPNHMGIMGNENVWWNDVLENGPASLHAGFFDIDWHSAKPELNNKVLLPILGDPYGKALESLQLQLHYETGCFSIHYHEHHFPVSPCTYDKVLGHRIDDLERELGPAAEAYLEYQSIRTAITHLPPFDVTEEAKVAERHREKERIKRRLATLTGSSKQVRAFLEHNVEVFNGQSGDSHSFDLLDDLLNAQPYRLASWRVASDEINYRRFFDVNELAALSMEKLEVFTAAHELIYRLLCEGKATGLRIDHPDGLFDPRLYLERLQNHYALAIAREIFEKDPECQGIDWKEIEEPLLDAIRRAATDRDSPFARPLYVVVEKILGASEPLPEDWPVYGTTGYEFLHALNDLLVDHDHAAAFTRLYKRWTDIDVTFRDLVYQKKFLTLQVSMSSELNLLATQLDRLSEKNRWSRDFTLNSLRRGLREIIACFDVYRSYITGPPVLERDRGYVERAVVQAKRRNPAMNAAIFDFVRDMLLLKHQDAVSEADRAEQLRFVGKFQQVTSPVMAKGVEDTSFYVYNRLLSLNEVGGDPRQFGSTVETFHRRNQERLARFPFSLSATATHDTKRGEDTRARLDVLSEMPTVWEKTLIRWARINKKHKVEVEADEEDVPGRNEEYFLYQTLVGSWPIGSFDRVRHAGFVERIQAYMRKAIHEAKVHTSWINPNPIYDRAIEKFVARILDPDGNAKFFEDFLEFHQRVLHHGIFNSLTQALLKVTSPGVADVYQGTELWDFSLVDPDNRRPVDYELRRQMLAALDSQANAGPEGLPTLTRSLTEASEDGRIKLYLLSRALRCRREHPGLFASGSYLPVHASGTDDESVCAFIRRQGSATALIAAPRLLTRRIAPGQLPLGTQVWKDGVLLLPTEDANRRWRNVFTGEVLKADIPDGQPSLSLAGLFASFPVALLLAEE